MRRKILKVARILAVMLASLIGAVVVFSIASPGGTRIARLRLELASTEACIPVLADELERDRLNIYSRDGKSAEQLDRWKAIVKAREGQLKEARRRAIDLRIGIRELEVGVVATKEEQKR